MEGDYNPGNRDNFLAKADPWIIAKAKATGVTVVTHESWVIPPPISAISSAFPVWIHFSFYVNCGQGLFWTPESPPYC